MHTLVLSLLPGLQNGTRRSECSFLNDFVTLTNLNAVLLLDESTDKHAITQITAYFSLLMLGADALTPTIIEQVWGQVNVVRHNLGGPKGDLDIICHCLILLAWVANNTFHLWLNTSFGNANFITTEALQHVLPGIHDIFLPVKEHTSTINVCKPLCCNH
jgi:hypothetical protein